MTAPALITLLLPLLLSSGAWAEQVYRCETNEGIAYQDIPCLGPGGPVEIQVHRPSAAEVSRSEQALSRMRSITSQIQAEEEAERLDRAGTPSRSSDSGAQTATVQPLGPGTKDKDEDRKRGRDKDDDDDLRPTSNCPLGLTNCKKAAPRVFRRPKSDPLVPLQGPQ